MSEPVPSPQRFALTLAYDGGPFNGWARQPGLPSVQEAIESALAVVSRQDLRVVVAGRTDTGVHASGQVLHVDLDAAAQAKVRVRDGAEPVEVTLVRRLNAVLARSTGRAVLIHSARPVPPGFDARFSALWRSYTYTVADGPQRWDPLRRGDTLFHARTLDVDAMQAELDSLLGLHDFRSFCKPREEATTVRELQGGEVVRGADGLVRVHLRADAFCHHMVRTIVGALVAVGEGREDSGWVGRRLDERTRDAKTTMVAGHALVLTGVGYPDDAAAGARAEVTRAKRTTL
ncbi:tRNA pseudouridine(38-40) synthase TruA [Galactobacter valiniphilus]|uniref:tRNA pseudouridine(38-40) synthase TruA n=1 Tax=Galactobacter valiniphilus TaxID=2676122 RepID=UPI003735AA8C